MQTNTSFRYINEVHLKDLANWSASALLSNQLSYKEGYPLMPIGALLMRNREKEILEDDKGYKQVTIKLYGKGVVQRGDELVLGKDIGTKNQFRVSAGQFIMSKIDARNGAFGIVPPELTGAITTQDFLSYNINTDLILPEFFVLVTGTKHFADLCQRASSGTTGRQRVDEKAFLGFRIPVPSISQQKGILIKYQELTSARNQLIKVIEENSLKIRTYFDEILGIKQNVPKKSSKKLHVARFKELIFWGVDKILDTEALPTREYFMTSLYENQGYYVEIFRGKSPKYDPLGNEIILNQKCNRWNHIDLSFARTVSKKWHAGIPQNIFTKEGDVIINSTGEGTIGRASFISSDFANLLIDSHILLLRVNQELLLPKFFMFLINSNFGQRQIEKLKSAKSTKQTELGIQNLLKIMFPIMNIEQQMLVCKELEQLEIENRNAEKRVNSLAIQALDFFESEIFTTYLI